MRDWKEELHPAGLELTELWKALRGSRRTQITDIQTLPIHV